VVQLRLNEAGKIANGSASKNICLTGDNFSRRESLRAVAKKKKKKYLAGDFRRGDDLYTSELSGVENSYPLFLWITLCITV